MINLIYNFLKESRINKIDKGELELQLLSHPDYPTMKSVSDTLDYFKIDNLVVEIQDSDNLKFLPKCFLTLYDESVLIMLKKYNRSLMLLDINGKKKRISESSFKEKWNNVVLIVEPSKDILNLNLSNKLFLGITSSVILILSLLTVTLIDYLFLLVIVLGVFFSSLILLKKNGFNSSLIRNICLDTKKSSCEDVIKSKGAKIFYIIDLADFCFVGFLILGLLLFVDPVITYILTVLTTPILLYSLSYQLFGIKKICFLCLGAVSCYSFLITISLLNLSLNNITINLKSVFLALSIIFFVVFTFYYLKNWIYRFKNMRDKAFRGLSLLKDKDFVKMLISERQKVNVDFLPENEIIFGDRNSKNSIVTITNPYCGHCKNAFDNSLNTVNILEDVKVIFRFNVFVNKTNDPKTRLVIRLVEIYFERGTKYFAEAYSSWFNIKNEKWWFKKYGEPNFNKTAIDLLNEQNQWCLNNQINYSPASTLNGFLYPSKLSHKDLPLIAESLLLYN